MNQQTQLDIEQALERLGELILLFVKDGIALGSLKSDIETYIAYQIDEIEYNESGIARYSTHPTYVNKSLWHRPVRAIYELVEAQRDKAVDELLNNFLPVEESTRVIERYIQQYALKCLETEDQKQRQDYRTTL